MVAVLSVQFLNTDTNNCVSVTNVTSMVCLEVSTDEHPADVQIADI